MAARQRPAGDGGRPGRVPGWLASTVMYEIYPQSFADSDGDGIGDLRGIIEPAGLPRLAGRGLALAEPVLCLADARRRLRRQRLPGGRASLRHHRRTSSRWSRRPGGAASGCCSTWSPATPRTSIPGSCGPATTRPTAGTSSPARSTGPAGPPGPLWVPSPGRRPGWYLPNFFPFQPALNFGYARTNPAEPWRQPVDAPGSAREPGRADRDHGALARPRGGRVPGRPGQHPGQGRPRLARDRRGCGASCAAGWTARYPDAVLMSEWNSPAVAIPAGFHADFYLAVGPEHGSLLNNGAGPGRGRRARPPAVLLQRRRRWAPPRRSWPPGAGMRLPQAMPA